MATTPASKLPQPWHTKSFHLARLWMTLSVVLLGVVFAIEDGKWSGVGSLWPALCFVILDLSVVLTRKEINSQRSPLITDGSTESEKQYKQLLWCLAGMAAGYAAALIFGNILITPDKGTPLRLAVVLIAANVPGWFLIRWLSEVLIIMNQYKEGVARRKELREQTPPIISQPVYGTASAQPQRLRAGNGGRP